MKAIVPLTTLVCLLLSATTTLADQIFNYPPEKPIFSISFPDSWKVTAEGDSLSAASGDDLVNMELVALEAEAAEGAVDLAKESLKEELAGIKFPDPPEKGELNGMNVTFLNGQVTIEGVKMAVNCAIFAPKKAGSFFMLFNIIPLEALKQHGEDVSKILNSVKGK